MEKMYTYTGVFVEYSKTEDLLVLTMFRDERAFFPFNEIKLPLHQLKNVPDSLKANDVLTFQSPKGGYLTLTNVNGEEV